MSKKMNLFVAQDSREKHTKSTDVPKRTGHTGRVDKSNEAPNEESTET